MKCPVNVVTRRRLAVELLRGVVTVLASLVATLQVCDVPLPGSPRSDILSAFSWSISAPESVGRCQLR